MDSSEFLIRILVKARNEISGVMQKAAGDIDKLTHAQERQVKSTQKFNQSIDDAKKRFASYSKEVADGSKDMEATAKTMRDFGREFDRLATRAKPGSDVANQLRQMAVEARRAAAVASEAQRQQTAVQQQETQKRVRSTREEAKEVEDAAKQAARARQQAAVAAERAAGQERLSTLRQQQAHRELRDSVQETLARYDLFNTEVERGAHSSGRSAAGYRQFANEIGTLQRKFTAGSEGALTLGESVEHARQRAAEYSDTARRATRGTDDLHGSFLRFFGIDSSKLDSIGERIAQFEHSANKSRFAVAALDNRLRGLVVVGVLVFFQQLVGVAVALGGALLALASNAAQAGAALVGMAVSGAAQAIPVLGLLAAAWGRVGAVFKAVQQNQKALAQAGFDNAAAADRQRSSARALENAQQGLADAHRRVADAQEGLTRARRDGVRQIEDLVAAERQAQLQAAQAVEAQIDAQRSLRESIRSGDIDAQAANEINLQQANLGRGDASTRLRRAREDNRRVGGNVENLDAVVAAKGAVEDARRAAVQAQKALDDARQSASETVKQVATGQRLLDQMLAQLSPAERRLYEVSNRIATFYQHYWSRRVLTPIIDSFTFAANRLLDLMHDNRITRAARDLSESIAHEIRRAVDEISSVDSIDFILRMGKEAQRNLPTVTDGLIAIFHIFQNIADAAAPAFNRFLGFLRDLLVSADDATSNSGGIAKLQDFFSRGERYAEGWIELGLAISNLFLAVVGASAREGQSALESMTNSVNDATAWVNDHRPDIRNFLREALRATAAILHAVGQVAVALFGMFHEDQVEVFAKAFETILLPVLVDVTSVVGQITKLLLEIFSTPAGSAFARLALGAILLFKAITPIIRLGSRLVILFGQVAGSEGLVVGGLRVISIATGPVGMAIAALASFVLLLSDRLGGLGDALKVVGILVGVATGAGLLAQVLGLSNAFERMIGKAGKLRDLFRRGGGRPGGGTPPAIAAVESTPVVTGGVTEAERTGASRKGSRLGRLFSGEFAGAAKGFLKGFAWLQLGLAAADGILSGFKHHSVRAGFQDFFHTLSFGLIPSFEESAKKAGDRAVSVLKRRFANANILPQISGLNETAPRGRRVGLEDLFGPLRRRPTGSEAGLVARGVGTAAGADSALQFPTEIGKSLDTLRDKYGKSFDSFLKRLVGFVNDFRGLSRRRDGLGIQNWLDDFNVFAKDAPPEFKSALDDMRESARKATKEISDRFKGVVADVTGNWNLLDANTSHFWRQMQQHITANMGVIKLRLGEDSAEGRRAMSKNFQQAAEKASEHMDTTVGAIRRAMRRGEELTDKGSQRIRELLIKSLTALGLTETQAVAKLRTGTLNTNPDLGTDKQGNRVAGHTDRAAGGYSNDAIVPPTDYGWLKQQGQRGRDSIPIMAAPGEAFLNWAHQRVIEPVLARAKAVGLSAYGSLSEVFKKVKGVQGPGSGYAGGGYVQGAITPPGGTPSLIRKLFGLGFNVTSAFRPGAITNSGNVSDHSSGHAWDFGDSVNNIRRLWSVVFPLRRQIKQLFGPSYVSHGMGYNFGQGFNQAGSENQRIHENHIHIAIAGAIRGALRRLLNTGGGRGLEGISYAGFSGPRVEGRGGIATIADRALRVGSRVANQRGREIAEQVLGAATGAGGGRGTIPAFKGAWVSVMRRIAQQERWNLGDWRQLVQGESGGNPGARNPSSGAFGLGQFLGATARAYAKFGALSHNASDQIRAMAQYIKDRYGSPTNALHTWLSRSPHWYERGGDVPGSGPVGAVLHGGEHVWTAAEVMRAGGHQVMYALRAALGGGKQSPGRHYQEGGGVFQPRDVDPTVPNLVAEAQRARAFIRRLRDPSSGRSNFTRSLRELIGQGGVIDDLNQAVTDSATTLGRQLKLTTFKINKFGQAVRGLSDVTVAERTLDNLRKSYGGLIGEQGVLQGTIQDITKRIDRIRNEAGRPSARQRRVLEYLRGYRRAIEKKLDDVGDGLAQSLEDQVNAVDSVIQARVDAAETRATRGTAALDLVRRGRALVGGTVLGAGAAPSNSALARQQANILRRQAGSLDVQAFNAGAQGHKKLAQQIYDQANDLRMQALEAVEQGMEADVEEVNRQAQRRTGVLDLRARVAQALGRVGDLGQIATERMQAINDQIGALAAQQSAAARAGNTALAESIADQIADLRTSITELAAQQLSDAADQVDAAAQRRNTQFDLRDRIANLVQSAGNAAGAFVMRGQTLAARGQNIRDQIGSLTPILAQAAQQGNQALWEKLTDEISDLNVQLSENEAAIRENTTQARQSAIDAITGRGSFLTSVFGGLGNLVQAVGAVTGVMDINTQRQLISQTLDALRATGGGLAQQLFEWLGIDVRGFSPGQLVQLMSSLNFSGIESNMSESDRTQFESLITAIIDNATAVQSNTQQLQELTGATTNQGWSTTAWEWFRNGIFNGSGGLLPQFQFPQSMSSAGTIYSPPLTSSSAASSVASSRNNSNNTGSTIFAPTINNEEKTVDMDADTLSNRLYWRFTTGSST